MADEEENVLDNWEDADTEELERRMDARQKQLDTVEKTVAVKDSKSLKEDSSREVDTIASIEVQTQLPLRIQDSDRTEYVAPIKILKRQTDATSASPSPDSHTSSSAAARQTKTLAEREAEYASARARILGTNYRPEESANSVPPFSHPAAVVVSREGRSTTTDDVKRQPKGPNGSIGFGQEESIGT